MKKQHDVNHIVIQKILGYCNDIVAFDIDKYGQML